MESAKFYMEVKKNFVKKKVFLPTYPNYFGDVTGNKTFRFFGLTFFNISCEFCIEIPT